MYKFALGVVIGLAAMAGAYGVAASTASGLASEFDTREAVSHSRNVEFSSAALRISGAHGAERAKCDLLSGPKKRACQSESSAKDKRGFAAAFQL